MRSRTAIGLAMLAAVAAGGCNASKSSNPLSPSVAGPIAGVSITAPKPLTPTVGATIEVGAQPVTLTLENASTTGQRQLSYLFEVALDADFANKVVSREGIAPGDGTTSFKLPESLASERTYYWRARAQDGANTGAYSSGVHFNVFTPIVLQAPQLVSPVADIRIAGRTPTLRLTNAARSGPVGSIVYEFQVSSNEAFNQLVATLEQGEQVSSTQVVYPGDLNYATRYYWRARAWEMTKNMPGPWSSTATFQTALAPAPTPEPTPVPVPVPGGYPNNGPGLVKYIMAKYPSYLAAGVSSSQRKSNMAFLRDRTIEDGTCGGMQLGWNLKRGGPELSIDYITYHNGTRWIGVDIAWDYDNTSHAIGMTWGEAPDDPYMTPGGYTNTFSCK